MKKKATTRTPKQRRSIEKKEKILKTGKDLFSKEGYHNVHSNAIAAEAGVAVGTFYAYFNDKKDVLLELIEQYQDNFFNAIFNETTGDETRNETADIRDLIRSMITGAFKAFDIDPEFHRVIYAMQFTDEDVKEIFINSEKREIGKISEFIKERIDSKNIEDPDAVAVIVHHAVTGVAHKIKLIDPSVSESAAIDMVSSMIMRFFKVE